MEQFSLERYVLRPLDYFNSVVQYVLDDTVDVVGNGLILDELYALPERNHSLQVYLFRVVLGYQLPYLRHHD